MAERCGERISLGKAALSTATASTEDATYFGISPWCFLGGSLVTWLFFLDFEKDLSRQRQSSSCEESNFSISQRVLTLLTSTYQLSHQCFCLNARNVPHPILANMHLAHLDTSSRSIESEDELSGKGTRKIIYQHGQFWCVCFLVSCSFFMMYHTSQQTILHEAFWLCVFLWHELVLLCRRRSSMAFFDTEP